MTSQQNLITVRGYVIALPKQGGREDAKVAVQDDDSGMEFLVVPRGMGLDLVDHINAKVEVTGTLQEKDEEKFIQVRQFKTQDDYDDDWYDDK